ncbi:MAG: hypothetical protein Kow0059_07450 [Candidatus Sumerlaeia bacterium]
MNVGLRTAFLTVGILFIAAFAVLVRGDGALSAAHPREIQLKADLGADKFTAWRDRLLEDQLVSDAASGAPPFEPDQAVEDDYTAPTETPWNESLPPAAPPAALNPDHSLSRPYEPPSAEGVAGGAYAHASTQPQGSLSDFIIYTNPGHGFTAGTTTWSTQRGITNGMVEDFGNLDQFNFFVNYCFNAGATIVPFRPVGYQPNEVVIDNDDPQVLFSGAWSNSTSTIFYGSAGDVPYRYASVADVESATARYTPSIPEAGFYPVYTWVRAGTDRIRQLYRIAHSGGVSEVRVNHRRVGSGWIWLGTYYFEQGEGGYCEISNQNAFAGQTGVVIADAIRFGNGMGSISRGAAGVSGYPRELENARYWIQESTGQGMPSSLYDGSGNDASDNVSAPPKMAAYMNQSGDGSFYDRLIFSFHSNAASGTARGAVGLGANGDMPQHQYEIATYSADEVNNDMETLDEGVAFGHNWANNTSNFYDGVTYGEIRDLYLQGEMTGTIIEVAFHDNAQDAYIMQDPRGRNIIGRACYQAIVKFIADYGGTGRSRVLLPDPPTRVRAINLGGGTVRVGWRPPAINSAGGDAPEGYRVYQSRNGYGFGQPVEVSGAGTMSLDITGLVPGETWFFRVAAFNSGGESMPTETVGVRVTARLPAPILVVNGYRRLDRFIAPAPFFANNLYGNATLVRPRQMNSFDYVVQHGRALAANYRYFDSCSLEALEGGDVTLAGYSLVVWIGGQQGEVADDGAEPEHDPFNATVRPIVQSFLAGGGRLFLSGSEIAWDMDRDSNQSDVESVFLQDVLKADYVDDDVYSGMSSPPNTVVGAAGTIFNGLSLTFDDGTHGTYEVEFPDVLNPSGGSVVAMRYTGSSENNTNAAVMYDGQDYKLIYLGFPFETITSEALRQDLMGRALLFLLPETPPSFGPNKTRLVRHILEIETIYDPQELEQADYNDNTRIEVGDVILAPE